MLKHARTLFVLTLLFPATAFAQLCDGDCGNDGAVTVDEVVTGVNLALGVAPLSQCNPFDRDGDGAVTVDEIVGAIGNALAGCPAPPGQSLRGVAATGMPIVGRVCAVDGGGAAVGCSATAVDGSFRIDTTGGSAPFLLKATPAFGQGQTQFSWSDVNDGLTNVSPFTTLPLLLATDYANLNELYAGWGALANGVDPDVLDDAVGAVLDHFADQLAGVVANGFDPFISAFDANGTGFDAVLDTLNFNFDFANGTASLNGTGLNIDFDPGTLPGGNYRLTITLAVGPAPAQQVAVVDNVPKPASRDEFCVPELYSDIFSEFGSFTVNSCTFDGSVGRLSATIAVSGFSISYTATYTYTPMP